MVNIYWFFFKKTIRVTPVLCPQQKVLCAAMLSERVVLVLSRKYVTDTWFSFEKTLKQLTQMSLHNQVSLGVLVVSESGAVRYLSFYLSK